MVIGSKYGRGMDDERDARKKTYSETKDIDDLNNPKALADRYVSFVTLKPRETAGSKAIRCPVKGLV